MKYKITFKFMEERAAEDDGQFHPLPLIHANRPHVHQGEEDFYAHEEHHEFLKRLTTLMYTLVLLFVVIFLMMEVKRSLGIDFIPGFKFPLEDFYYDVVQP
jgi:hypothetical protein